MKDFFDSIKTYLFDRLTSPLLGAFTVSWFVLNHRYVFILFSDRPIEYRFNLAQQLVYNGEYEFWLRNIVGPLAGAAAYVFIYPWVNQVVTSYLLRRQVRMKSLRDQIEGATLLTREESQKVVRDAVEERATLMQRVATLAEERRSMDTANTQLQRQLADVQNNYNRDITAARAESGKAKDELVEQQRRANELKTSVETLQKEIIQKNAELLTANTTLQQLPQTLNDRATLAAEVEGFVGLLAKIPQDQKLLPATFENDAATTRMLRRGTDLGWLQRENGSLVLTERGMKLARNVGRIDSSDALLPNIDALTNDEMKVVRALWTGQIGHFNAGISGPFQTPIPSRDSGDYADFNNGLNDLVQRRLVQVVDRRASLTDLGRAFCELNKDSPRWQRRLA